MKILLTGTAGFTGIAVSKNFLHRGDAVVGTGNISDYYGVSLKYAQLADAGVSKTAEHLACTWSNTRIAKHRRV